MKRGEDDPARPGAGLRTVWHFLTEPTAAITDPRDRYRSRFLSSLLIVGIPIGVITTLDARQFDAGGQEVALAAVAGNVLSYLLSRTRLFEVAAWSLIAAIILAPFFVLTMGGPSLNVGFMGLAVILAGILFGPRATIAVGVACVGLLGAWAVSVGDTGGVVDMRLGLAFLVSLSALVVLGVHHRRELEEHRLRQIGIEIGARKDVEDRLRHAAKLEAVGQLAGGVAHDFNNLLTTIGGTVDLLAEDVPEESSAAAELEQISTAVAHAAELTRKLLTLARRQPLRTVVIDVHAAIEDLHVLLRRTIDRRIDIELQLGAAHSFVLADPDGLHNALLNLCLNARDAMASDTPSGTLSIVTRSIEIERGGTVVPAIEIAIGDTGHGVPEEIRERIFDPFFTTKELGTGTGLGLAGAKGFVVDTGGELELDSRPGRTVLSARLPTTTSAADEGAVGERAPATDVRGRILLIDDEDVVRRVARRVLERAGHQVIDFGDPIRALEHFGQSSQRPEVVLLDLVMPRMGGEDVLQRLQEIDPRVPVVVCSGYAREEVMESAKEHGAAAFLNKPYSNRELAACIQEQIARRRAHG